MHVCITNEMRNGTESECNLLSNVEKNSHYTKLCSKWIMDCIWACTILKVSSPLTMRLDKQLFNVSPSDEKKKREKEKKRKIKRKEKKKRKEK